MSDVKSTILNKIKNKNSNVNSSVANTDSQSLIFNALKKQDYRLGLIYALQSMDKVDRALYILEKLEGGAFRAYSLGIGNIKKVILATKVTKDSNGNYDLTHVHKYISEITKNSADYGVFRGDTFYCVRLDILYSMSDGDGNCYNLADILTFDFKANVKTEDAALAKKYLLEICSILYPDNLTYKVLFT